MIRITGTLHENLRTFVIITRLILLKIRNVSNDVVDKIKIHNLHSTTISENRVTYETMWKDSIQPKRLCMLDN